jgi:hypothetical protein
MEGTTGTTREISCQQLLKEDASVYSRQWMVVPATVAARLSPSLLLERYLGYIRSWTWGVVRPVAVEGGVEFRLLGSGLSLISFTGPTGKAESSFGYLTLRICGGFLVQRGSCDRGELSFMVEQAANGVKVTLLLTDYCPLLLGSQRPSRLRRFLYRCTQALIHRLVTVHFLEAFYREMAGGGACIRVVHYHGGEVVPDGNGKDR